MIINLGSIINITGEEGERGGGVIYEQKQIPTSDNE